MTFRPVPYRVLIAKLRAAGFEIVSQRGSHVKLVRTRSGVTHTAVVPRHRDIAPGTVNSILNQAGMTWSDLED